MPSFYIRALIGLFFVAAVGDFLAVATFSSPLPARLLLLGAIGALLWLLLRARLLECGFSPRWALLALLPGIGFPFGLFLYFCPPSEERDQDSATSRIG